MSEESMQKLIDDFYEAGEKIRRQLEKVPRGAVLPDRKQQEAFARLKSIVESTRAAKLEHDKIKKGIDWTDILKH